MKLLIVSKDKISGFTIMEVMIVIALIGAVAGVSFYFSLDNLRGYSFHSDRDTLVSALQHARAEAMANVCRGPLCVDGKPHGVKILNNKFVIFQGLSYDTRDPDQDAILDANPSITYSGDTEIIFSQLSGDVSSVKNINMKDTNIHESYITINTEGQIIWTN